MKRIFVAAHAASGLAVGWFVAMALTFAWLGRDALAEPARLILGTEWAYRGGSFGAASLLYGSVVVAALSLLLAAPIAFGTALFLSERLPRRGRILAKAMIELLAGVPSVVYGLLGVLLLRDWVYRGLARFEPLSGDTLITAGLLLAIMILPTLTTLADDSLQGVPAEQRSAGRALGLTHAETLFLLVAPQARAGLLAATLLALGRALGETIAVYLVIGRLDGALPSGPFDVTPLLMGGQTMTTKLGGPELFLAAGNPEHFGALMGLACLLLVVCSLTHWLGRRLAGSPS